MFVVSSACVTLTKAQKLRRENLGGLDSDWTFARGTGRVELRKCLIGGML
jgi:hypothetical protein